MSLLLGTFLIHIIHVYILTGSIFGGGLLQVLVFRLNQQSSIQSQIVGFSWTEYIKQQISWLSAYYSKPLLVLSLMSLLLIVYRWLKTKIISKKTSYLLLSLYISLGYPIVFSNAIFIHDYLNFYFLPFITISAFYILNKISSVDTYRVIVISISLLVVLISYLSTRPYSQALLNSSNSKIGYDLGILLKTKTDEGKKIGILSEQFWDFYSKFISFYSDRQIEHINLSNFDDTSYINEFKNVYDYVLVIPNHFQNKYLIDKLNDTYPHEIGEHYILYNVQ